MTDEVTRSEYVELQARLLNLCDTLTKEKDEPARYRKFWEKAWPITIAILGTISGVFGIYFIKRMTAIKELEATSKLLDEIFDPNQVELRWFVYNRLPPDPDQATDDDIKKAQQVAHSLDKLGYLVHCKLLSEKHAIDMCYPFVVRMWDKLAPYVIRGRLSRGEDPNTGRHSRYFQELAALCYRYWKRLGMEWVPKHADILLSTESP